MAKNILLSEGLTSIVNDSEAGEENRAKAAQVASSIIKSQRYTTCSVNNLAEWTDAPLFRYAFQGKVHKDFVKEFYIFQVIRDAVASGADPPSYDTADQAFEALSGDIKDQHSLSTAKLHALILYYTWSFIVPFYINKRATGGERSVHWSAIRDSTVKAQRLAMYDLVKTIAADEHVPRAPPGTTLLQFYHFNFDADDEGIRYLLEREFAKQAEQASEGKTASTSSSGVASHFVHAMWTACMLLGRQPHPVSVVCPLRTSEFHLLHKGHGCPEDLLIGNRVVPPLSYASLVSDDTFESSKEYAILCDFTKEPFYVDINVSDVYDVYRATRLASKASAKGDLHDTVRQIYKATSDNGRANFVNTISLAFPALRMSQDRLKPDANDLLAIKTFLPGADLTAIESSGSVLAYTVNKYLAYFEDEISNVKRKIRANITESRALDRGGIKAKTAKGNLPAEVEEPLDIMVRALRTQIWLPIFDSVIAPWMSTISLPQATQAWLGVPQNHAASLLSFANSVGFTKGDYVRLQAVLIVHLAMFRQQVYRDSLLSEYTLEHRDGTAYYKLDMTRSFKTATATNRDSLCHLTAWDLSVYESCLVHALILLRPILTTGTGKSTEHMFLSKTGTTCINQRDVKDACKVLGEHWLGVPELSSHPFRSAWISKYINSGLINTDNELELLAAAVQVSRRTMLEAYMAPSHNNPTCKLARRIRDGGVADLDADEDMEEDVAESSAAAGKPYGVALSKVREPFKPLAAIAVDAHNGNAKEAFGSLVAARKAGRLSSDQQWFQMHVTHFEDKDAGNFDRWFFNKNKKAKRQKTA
ncbi:hypothetical protein JKP88DRAFT_241096 [Tribonema minus]|uniref:Uncharacterized protein n=1 Tax=Tribonema minus TaxID=303371 RepID=A0A836CI79_9STRA|nr:hypothetical protein JKP88DRAFT_241096 [Tribonema minus]